MYEVTLRFLASVFHHINYDYYTIYHYTKILDLKVCYFFKINDTWFDNLMQVSKWARFASA